MHKFYGKMSEIIHNAATQNFALNIYQEYAKCLLWSDDIILGHDHTKFATCK